MSKSALESTWLYHEIGRCHLELGHFSDAKEFGDKSLEAAQEADDDVWQLNASVLVAQSLGKLRWELKWCIYTERRRFLPPLKMDNTLNFLRSRLD